MRWTKIPLFWLVGKYALCRKLFLQKGFLNVAKFVSILFFYQNLLSIRLDSMARSNTDASCCSVKNLCFIKMCDVSGVEKSRAAQSYQNCHFFYHIAIKKIHSLQQYKILATKLVPIDATDTCLHFIRLRQYCNTEGIGKRSWSKEYKLVPIGSIRSLTHVLEKDTDMLGVCNSCSQRFAAASMSKSSHGGGAQQFHINRFYTLKWKKRVSQNEWSSRE